MDQSMSSMSKSIIKAAPEFAIRFTSTALQNMMSKQTVQSFFRGQFRKMTTGSREKPFKPVMDAELACDEILAFFNRMQIMPKLIGIDGIPGAGKSTLGRTLANRLCFQWCTLKWQEMQFEYDFKQQHIYENVRLIRTQNIELFDVLIYLDLPVELAKQRVIDRDRNGMLADIVRFDRMKLVGDVAFALLESQEWTIHHPTIRIKVKDNKFNHTEHIHTMLDQKGIYWDHSMTKEEKLFALCYGKPKKGILAYANFGAYNNVILSAFNSCFK